MQQERFQALRQLLNTHYAYFNNKKNLYGHPDPLQIPHQHRDFPHFDALSLLCALYAYGNAQAIVKTLRAMPFSALLEGDSLRDMPPSLFPYYRFQTREDTKAAFLVLADLIKKGGIKTLFVEAYSKNHNILDGIKQLERLANESLCAHNMQSYGVKFLFGNPHNTHSPRKRYNMFLRWMVRRDNIDFGLWSEVCASDLLLPLDTHTFSIARQLGLCTTKTYSLRATQEITQNLKCFDSNDPIKYDFALYRIGQLGLHTT